MCGHARVSLHVKYGCGFTLAPYCVSWHDSQHHPSWSAVALQSEAQREAAPHRVWLLLPCPAPGRHQASPSHSNYSWHCLKTCREKATHRFYWEAHTHYLTGFTALSIFPAERRRFIWYGTEMHCDTHTHWQKAREDFRHWRRLEPLTCLKWGISKAVHFPMLLPSECDPDVSKYLFKAYTKLWKKVFLVFCLHT